MNRPTRFLSAVLLALGFLPASAPAQSSSTVVYRASLYATQDAQPEEKGGVLATFDGTYLRVAGFFDGLNSNWRSVDLLKGSPESPFTIITNLYPPSFAGPTTDGFYLADALTPDEAAALAAGEVHVNVRTIGQGTGEAAARLQPLEGGLEIFHAPLTRTTGEQVEDVGFFLGALSDTTLYLSGGFSGLHAAWTEIRLLRYDAFGNPHPVETYPPSEGSIHSSGGLYAAVELTQTDAALLRNQRFAVRVATTAAPEGEVQAFLAPQSLPTDAEDDPDPSASALSAAYPNPFGVAATLTYRTEQAGSVSVRVYDLLGRPVATIHSGLQPAGEHTARLEAGSLPAGTYLVVLEADGRRSARTVTLVR